MPIPSPTASAPTATPAPLVEAASAIGALTAFTIPVPADWEMVKLSGGAITSTLEQIRTASPDLAQNVQTVLSAAGPRSEILVAWTKNLSGTATNQVQVSLVALTLPPNGMTLLRYIEDIGARLAQQTNTIIQKQGILYDLRTDGQPVGVVQYQLANGSAGYQALLFNKNATEMLLITFAGQPQPFAIFLSTFFELVDKIE